jgi:hypothetical protein
VCVPAPVTHRLFLLDEVLRMICTVSLLSLFFARLAFYLLHSSVHHIAILSLCRYSLFSRLSIVLRSLLYFPFSSCSVVLHPLRFSLFCSALWLSFGFNKSAQDLNVSPCHLRHSISIPSPAQLSRPSSSALSPWAHPRTGPRIELDMASFFELLGHLGYLYK